MKKLHNGHSAANTISTMYSHVTLKLKNLGKKKAAERLSSASEKLVDN